MKFSTAATLRAVASSVEMRLLEQLFDHTPDIAFFIKDAAGRYIVVNDSLVERHGLRRKSEMLGRRPREVCHFPHLILRQNKTAPVRRRRA